MKDFLKKWAAPVLFIAESFLAAYGWAMRGGLHAENRYFGYDFGIALVVFLCLNAWVSHQMRDD